MPAPRLRAHRRSLANSVMPRTSALFKSGRALTSFFSKRIACISFAKSSCSWTRDADPVSQWRRTERTDHEVTDAAPADEMAVRLKALRDTGACHARSRILGYA